MAFPSASKYSPAPVGISMIPNQYFQLQQPDVLGAASRVNQFEQQERKEAEQQRDDEYEKDLALVLKKDEDPETPDMDPEEFADKVGEVMLRHGRVKEFEDLMYQQSRFRNQTALEQKRLEEAKKPSYRQFGDELLEIGADGSIKTIRTKSSSGGSSAQEASVSVYDESGREFRVPKSKRDELINQGGFTSRAPQQADFLSTILSGQGEGLPVKKQEGSKERAEDSKNTRRAVDKQGGEWVKVDGGWKRVK